jgi:minor histocompatibility antigen H13
LLSPGVFGTDVMVTVAKSFDAPIKLLFPQFGFDADSRPSMLGLGDIVIPGIFIALLLRYDLWRNIQRLRAEAAAKKQVLTPAAEHNLECLYCHIDLDIDGGDSSLDLGTFHQNLVAYFVGLSTTVGVMYTFHAAQPALLYLVPACLGTAVASAMIRGDLKQLWKYTENEEDKAAEIKKNDDIAVASAPSSAPSTSDAASTKEVAAADDAEDSVDAATESDEGEGIAVIRRSTQQQSSSKKKKRSARAD